MPLIAIGKGAAGRTGLFLDDDLDLVSVSGGGGGDDLFDRAGALAGADDVGDVKAAIAVVEVEAEPDGVVGVGRGGAGLGCGQIPEAHGTGKGGQLAAVDLLEPVPLEELAFVGYLPVAIEKPRALGGREDGERADVAALVEVRVVSQAGWQEPDV